MPSQLQSDRSQSAAPMQSDPKAFQKEWAGKRIDDVETKYGRPTRMETLEDTGGKRCFYLEPGSPHYVFEYNAHGEVIFATPAR